jgi:hypothetical protein
MGENSPNPVTLLRVSRQKLDRFARFAFCLFVLLFRAPSTFLISHLATEVFASRRLVQKSSDAGPSQTPFVSRQQGDRIGPVAAVWS